MKRVLALLLALMVVFSFAACGADQEDVRGEQINNGSATAGSDAEFSLGDTEGLTYENKFIGIGCTLENGWSFYSDEQIKQINNTTADMAGDEYAEAMKNATVVYDMFATDANETNNMSVVLEKVNLVSLATFDAEKNFRNQFDLLKQTFENMGCTDVTFEIGTVRIDEEEHTCLNTSAQINGAKMYQKQVAIKCSGYIATITVTTFFEDTTEAIYAKFYAVK